MKIPALLLITSGLLFAGCQKKAEEQEKPPTPVVEVKTAQAEISDLAFTVNATATVFPREQANIAARITARIVKLNVRKGATVAAGQPLVVLENRDLIAQRDEAKAAIAEAEANLQKTASGTVPADIERARGQVDVAKAALNQAQKNYDRRKDLFEKGAIPQRDLLVSETELAQARSNYDVSIISLDLLQKQSSEKDIRSAQSRLEQAKARLEGVNAQLEFTTIRSPFAGVITEQMMYPGDMAKPDAPIFTLMNLSVAIARAQMPEADLRGIRAGQTCSFVPPDQKDVTFAGHITTISQAVDPQRRTVEVWCEIPNPQRRLKGSDFGEVRIVTGSAKQAVVVPVAAVQFAEDGKKGTVMIVDAKNIAHAKEVEVGETTNGKVRIIAGLSGGETVIIEGGYHLPDGTKVEVKKDEDDEKKGDKKDDDEKKGEKENDKKDDDEKEKKK
ncbi:MAG: efflux RND transporter periplasmic adaptor subunit [Blastocatellia bacterium]